MNARNFIKGNTFTCHSGWAIATSNVCVWTSCSEQHICRLVSPRYLCINWLSWESLITSNATTDKFAKYLQAWLTYYNEYSVLNSLEFIAMWFFLSLARLGMFQLENSRLFTFLVCQKSKIYFQCYFYLLF